MKKFSVIVPVYNRPEEIVELLDSLTIQAPHAPFEVIVIEDGSAQTCEAEIEPYRSQLDLKYIKQENQGPGQARNNGARQAEGEYLLFFDSDCVIPSEYLATIEQALQSDDLDCFGGPDRAHKFFSPMQKAISFSMTSLFTTGGIRGGKKKMDRFYPRSYNLGVKHTVFDEVGGFSNMRYGEDIDFSMNVLEHGYRIGLIDSTFVYHKRRTNLRSFYKQVFSSGTARINIASRHKGALKLVHLLPALFTLGIPVVILLAIFVHWSLPLIYVLYALLLAIESYKQFRNVRVALLSIAAGFTQLVGYGLGFITAAFIRLTHGKQNDYVAFRQTFYK